MTEKEALLKSIAMWEFIKKEHLNKDGKYDLKEYSDIYSKTSIENAKAKYLSKYEYLDIKNRCYLCEFALQKMNEENAKALLKDLRAFKMFDYCQFCSVKNWHIYRNEGFYIDKCYKNIGSVYMQANKFKVIDDTLELLKETYNNYCNNNNGIR